MIRTRNAPSIAPLPAICMLLLLSLLPFLTPLNTFAQNDTLVPEGAIWRYLDDGNEPDSNWTELSFNDNAWDAGPAKMGYGEGNEATAISSGIPENRRITTYFRHKFQVPAGGTRMAILNLLRDDGAIVYLNGVQIVRSNVYVGNVGHWTIAASAVEATDESFWYTFPIPSLTLNSGPNVLAVEIHQRDTFTNGNDLGFDLRLFLPDAPHVVRGPYLQLATPNSMMVKWRTFPPGPSEIRYGLNPFVLNLLAIDTTVVANHALKLRGLLPETKYYYRLVNQANSVPGATEAYSFYTAPLTGTAPPIRIWALGDCGTGDANAQAVRDAYYAFSDSLKTDMMLFLGDNAYNIGTDFEYQKAIFENMFEAQMRESVSWSCTGNHDMFSASSATQSGPYYDIFSFPKQGEAGGIASGTEAYYSFDYGNVHFISLDSDDSDRSAVGPMMTWLKNDLLAHNARWTIAFWHHPPYTKGSHDSDNPGDSGGRMADMRQTFLPVMEAAGVDLVLSGHSHSYERSYLLNGHYGLSASYLPSMAVDSGDGRVDGDGAYRKNAEGPGSKDGAVYLTAGSSGKVGGGMLNHPAHFMAVSIYGSVVIEIEKRQLDLKFLTKSGAVMDYFTMIKDGITFAPITTTEEMLPLKVFPNPVERKLTLLVPETAQGPFAFNLRNMRGIVVKKGSSRSREIELELAGYSAGVYLVEVQAAKDGQLYMARIVVR